MSFDLKQVCNVGLFAWFILLSACSSQAINAQDKLSSFDEVSIAGSQLRQIYSEKVGQQYQLMINLPINFDKNRRYPVIYVLDAQWDFPLISASYGQMYYDGFVPEAIVVGITWAKGDDPNVLRVRDFTPSQVPRDEVSGGAAKFLAFIKQELIPFVASEYGGSGQRVLMGSSLGGLFTLYALFSEPQLFNGYIPTASASGWDNGVLYQLAQTNEKAFKAQIQQQPVKLYSAVGELDGLKADFMHLQQFLSDKNYQGLQFAMQVLPKLSHAGIKAPGNAWGLQYIFEQPDLALTVQQMVRWAGSYQQVAGLKTLAVEVHEGRLVLYQQGQTVNEFHAASENTFYLQGQLYRLNFMQDSQTTHLQIDTFGASEHFVKAVP